MATISFQQNVVVKDEKTIEKIKKDLKNYKPEFCHVKPDKSIDKTEEVAKLWFKR